MLPSATFAISLSLQLPEKRNRKYWTRGEHAVLVDEFRGIKHSPKGIWVLKVLYGPRKKYLMTGLEARTKPRIAKLHFAI
jgi:hypothetical protein